jgi:hypothetical protein
MGTLIRKLVGFMPVAALVMVAMSLLPTPAFAANVGIKPTNPDPTNSRTQSIFIYQSAVNTTLADSVSLTNNGALPESVIVYAVDSQISSGGAFACAQKVEVATDLGSWITLKQESVTIAAGATISVPFTISVPSTAATGEHDACLIVQSDPAKSPTAATNAGVSLSYRSGARVILTVPGELIKKISIGSLTSVTKDTKITATPTAKNDGNVSADALVTTDIVSLFGGVISTSGGSYPLLPRSEAAWNFEMPTPYWGGFYQLKATVAYDSDANSVIGKEAKADTTLSTQQLVFFMPQLFASIVYTVGVIALLTIVIVLIRKHRQPRRYRRNRTRR